MAELRDYQSRAITALRGWVSAGRRRPLLVAPTGSGKSIILTEVTKLALQMGGSVLIVVHLRELVSQTYRHLQSLGVERIGVMRGDDGRVDPWAKVQIASIQTLARRDRPKATVVILDEAHRSLADSYVTNVWEAYQDAIIIGCTATPCRGDGRPLGERYDCLVEAATYSALIAAGHVAEPIVYSPERSPDLSGVRRVAGDWDDGELERRMSALVGNLTDEWRAHAGGRKTIVFASGISHSRNIVERFNAMGVSAEHLDGTTPGTEREAILARLETGETSVVSNCAVLTEGFDMPSIRCAVIARPTLSLVLHMQTAGRCLRPGAERPVILDHADNCARFGFPHEDRVWRLDGPAVRKTVVNPYRTCGQCFVYFERRLKACPYCGWTAPAAERALPVEEPGRLTTATPASIERAFFDAQVNKAREKGFKPGFASAKFKEKFGRWPAWSWSEEVKRDYACDEDWQERQQRRERERQFWNEQKSKSQEPEPEAADVTSESPEDFASWFESQ